MAKHALALVADSHYLSYTKHVFAAAKTRGCWDGDYILIAHEVDEEDLAWFQKNGIYIIRSSNLIHVAPNENKAIDWPSVVYAKLMFFHPECAHWDTIVYLDTDVIIRSDIRGLLSYEGFAAREESMGMPLKYQFIPDETYLSKDHKEAIKRLNLDLNSKSFNVGVMVIPTKNNTQAEFDALVSLANNIHGLAYFPEQAVLNIHFQKRWTPLPYAYNDMYVHDWFIPRKNDKDAVILHVVGSPKPWDSVSPYHQEWRHYRELSDDFGSLKAYHTPTSKENISRLELLVNRWKWLGRLGRWWWRINRRFSR